MERGSWDNNNQQDNKVSNGERQSVAKILVSEIETEEEDNAVMQD